MLYILESMYMGVDVCITFGRIGKISKDYVSIYVYMYVCMYVCM